MNKIPLKNIFINLFLHWIHIRVYRKKLYVLFEWERYLEKYEIIKYNYRFEIFEYLVLYNQLATMPVHYNATGCKCRIENL